MNAVGIKQDWMKPLIRKAITKPEVDLGHDKSLNVFQDIDSCQNYCKRITAFHSKSFFMASKLLPKSKREAVRALYAFCRTTDDIVDEATDVGDWQLKRWRADTTNHSIRFNDPVIISWANARANFQIPNQYAHQLIDGVEMDLYKNSYKNFKELTTYCYGVASTVGLMSMHIVGYSSQQAIPYAIKLGVALQMTNILRDVNEDWENGRCYLPNDELEYYGITEDHFYHKINDDKWKQFMRFQIDRNLRLYKDAWPGIQLLHPDGQMAIAAAASFYRQILDRIIANDYDVFSQRAAVSKWGKIKRLPDLLLKYKFSNSLNSIMT